MRYRTKRLSTKTEPSPRRNKQWLLSRWLLSLGASMIGFILSAILLEGAAAVILSLICVLYAMVSISVYLFRHFKTPSKGKIILTKHAVPTEETLTFNDNSITQTLSRAGLSLEVNELLPFYVRSDAEMLAVSHQPLKQRIDVNVVLQILHSGKRADMKKVALYAKSASLDELTAMITSEPLVSEVEPPIYGSIIHHIAKYCANPAFDKTYCVEKEILRSIFSRLSAAAFEQHKVYLPASSAPLPESEIFGVRHQHEHGVAAYGAKEVEKYYILLMHMDPPITEAQEVRLKSLTTLHSDWYTKTVTLGAITAPAVFFAHWFGKEHLKVIYHQLNIELPRYCTKEIKNEYFNTETKELTVLEALVASIMEHYYAHYHKLEDNSGITQNNLSHVLSMIASEVEAGRSFSFFVTFDKPLLIPLEILQQLLDIFSDCHQKGAEAYRRYLEQCVFYHYDCAVERCNALFVEDVGAIQPLLRLSAETVSTLLREKELRVDNLHKMVSQFQEKVAALRKKYFVHDEALTHYIQRLYQQRTFNVSRDLSETLVNSLKIRPKWQNQSADEINTYRRVMTNELNFLADTVHALTVEERAFRAAQKASFLSDVKLLNSKSFLNGTDEQLLDKLMLTVKQVLNAKLPNIRLSAAQEANIKSYLMRNLSEFRTYILIGAPNYVKKMLSAIRKVVTLDDNLSNEIEQTLMFHELNELPSRIYANLEAASSLVIDQTLVALDDDALQHMPPRAFAAVMALSNMKGMQVVYCDTAEYQSVLERKLVQLLVTIQATYEHFEQDYQHHIKICQLKREVDTILSLLEFYGLALSYQSYETQAGAKSPLALAISISKMYVQQDPWSVKSELVQRMIDLGAFPVKETGIEKQQSFSYMEALHDAKPEVQACFGRVWRAYEQFHQKEHISDALLSPKTDPKLSESSRPNYRSV